MSLCKFTVILLQVQCEKDGVQMLFVPPTIGHSKLERLIALQCNASKGDIIALLYLCCTQGYGKNKGAA